MSIIKQTLDIKGDHLLQRERGTKHLPKSLTNRSILQIQKGYMANNVVIYCIVNYKFEYNFKFYNNKLSEKKLTLFI